MWIVIFAIVVVIILVCNMSGQKEHYRRRGGRRRGTFRGLWSPWSWYPRYRYGYAWPYLQYASGWPPCLYGNCYPDNYGYNYVSSPKCININPASDCPPDRPYKIGTDTTNDGKKDLWTCCRKY